MKKKLIRCILSSFLVGSMALGLVACDTSGDSEKEKDSTTKMEAVEGYVAEANSNAAHVAMMKSSDTIVAAKTEQLFTLNSPTPDISGVQGGCTDGKYYYQAFYRNDGGSNQANNECIIVKYDMETKEVVVTSEIMQLNHINDMTYNRKIGCLVVCHNAPFANLVSYVNPETLEYIDTIAIDEFIYSIHYNETRDQYMVGISGGQTFKVLDADFKAVTEELQPSDRALSSTTQGGACDDDFIYFVLYKPNVITVYDWDGNFVTLIELSDISDVIFETENVTVLDGEIYIGCNMLNQSKSAAFKLSGLMPKPATEEPAEESK